MDRRCVDAAATQAVVQDELNIKQEWADMDLLNIKQEWPDMDLLNIKQEWADMDLDVGPTVIQHMDCRTSQPDISVVKQESKINGYNVNPIPSGGVKEETSEDEWRAVADAQRGDETARSEHRAPPGSYSCDTCAKTFTYKASFKRHCRCAHLIERHKCAECDKAFKNKYHLERHAGSVHSKQQYECAVCNKICKSKLSLAEHLLRIHRGKPVGAQPTTQSMRQAQPESYSCDTCAKKYTFKASFKQHCKYAHLTERHKCAECDKEYKCKYYLERHKENVHSKRQYECAICKRICKSKISLAGHLSRIHPSKPAAEGSEPSVCVCDYCQKTFTLKSGLRNHITDVHGSGSYKCGRCNKYFKCDRYLKKHAANAHTTQACNIFGKSLMQYRIKRRMPKEHPGSKPRVYVCDHCRKMFSCKDRIITHISSVHASGSHKCGRCDKCFKCEQYLRFHTARVHAAEPRVFTCDHCQKTYTSKTRIIYHIRCVHASGSYECRQCDKRFKCEQYLTKHTANVHTKPKQACRVCGKSLRASYLTQHMRYKHGDERLQREVYGQSDRRLNDLDDQQSAEGHQ